MSVVLDVPLLIRTVAGPDPAVCECGAGPSVLSFGKMTLVEPHPEYYRKAVEKYPAAKVHNLAIVDDSRRVVALRLHGDQSHLGDIPDCPVAHRRQTESEIIEVPAATFDQVDTGFDVVILDMEGAEWYALKHMTSRPVFLMVETHSSSTEYVNPYLNEICEWVRQNAYRRLYKGISSTIWIREGSGSACPRSTAQ